MAARIFIDATAGDLRELGLELHRIADIALLCAKEVEKQDRTYHTDGFKNAIDGLDSITKLLGGIVGVYNSPPARMAIVRSQITNKQMAMRAQKDFEDAAADKMAQPSGGSKKPNPMTAAEEPAKPPRKSNRKSSK
jgi:hypothetical protein